MLSPNEDGPQQLQMPRNGLVEIAQYDGQRIEVETSKTSCEGNKRKTGAAYRRYDGKFKRAAVASWAKGAVQAAV